MNETHPIFIGSNPCGDCLRCVRECPVKAVKVEQSQAEILDDLCVHCGVCVMVCPSRAVRVRDDIWLSRQCIKNNEIKVASLSPSWVTDFPGIEPNRMVEALKLLGFDHVSESSFGAEAILERQLEELRARPGIHVSSHCPAIVRYIRKYRPKMAHQLMPVKSPLAAHAELIRQWWGPQAKIIHISSCTAGKHEAAQYPGLVEIALTFKELKQWFYDEEIEFDKIPGLGTYRFEPCEPRPEFTRYTLEKGVISEEILRERGLGHVKIVSKSGLAPIDRYLYLLPHNLSNETVWLNLSACHDGCVHTGGSVASQRPYFDREIAVMKAYENRKCGPYSLPQIDTTAAPGKDEPIGFVAEADTVRALTSIGILTERDQINCGGCGYVTCRRFAKALSKGHAQPGMCVPHLKKQYTEKFTKLLQRIPSGVVVIDEGMRIMEANRSFAAMLGPDVEHLFDSTPGMAGADARKIVPFHALFREVLESGEESLEKDVLVKDHMVKVSIYTIRKNKLVIAIVRNFYVSQVRNEEVIIRTQQVIRENMETVQKMAGLLGENAARTEAILNSILDSQSIDDADY